MLVQVVVTSHLNHCNSLLHRISDGLLTKLQNAAVHVMTGTKV